MYHIKYFCHAIPNNFPPSPSWVSNTWLFGQSSFTPTKHFSPQLRLAFPQALRSSGGGPPLTWALKRTWARPNHPSPWGPPSLLHSSWHVLPCFLIHVTHRKASLLCLSFCGWRQSVDPPMACAQCPAQPYPLLMFVCSCPPKYLTCAPC